ncbi:TetR/AcrR family transcriptional regulator [Arcobacter sp. LA11]|uniref:TetR/AcrR family transcriptional regulator n=1 Tax=Arcobacter sp. LA11 TaxID=1898176 RepID=UPI0009322E00|nr:TetR/AcrR family transcriptional regulator [Arcobacter sp. LA11]
MQNKLSTKDKLLDSAYIEIYTYGFQGCNVDRILKHAKVPKGSMYHHYKSKKELALAVIKERITPKMLTFFSFETVENENEIDTIKNKLTQISKIDYLLKYGCPLNKLVREMFSLDDSFKIELEKTYAQIIKNIENLLEIALKNNHIKKCNIKTLSLFIYTSTIGNISIGEDNITKESYLGSLQHLFNYLDSIKN